MKATPIHPGRSYLVSGLGFEIPVLAKNGVLAICAILRNNLSEGAV